MTHAQINPKLIQLLTNKTTSEIPGFPTTSMLPGKYTKAILEDIKSIAKTISKNNQTLTCNTCGKKGKYDVGLLLFNTEKINKNETDNEKRHEELLDCIQMTGYFRCQHCNAAGNWKLSNKLYFSATATVIPFINRFQKRSTVGQLQLTDGTSHKYATDSEDHLLNLLKEDPQDFYIWNRLGNLYNQGDRPELAASAFEHSISINPRQVESHFSLGDLLRQIKDYPNAGYHFRQMLLHAEADKKIPAEKSRKLLADGFQSLYFISQQTNGEITLLPTLDEFAKSGRKFASLNKQLEYFELKVYPDKLESFFPMAEMYMGKRAEEIPLEKRTFHQVKTNNIPFKSKNQKKNRKK